MLRDCLKIESGPAAVDFGGGQGGEACASPQRAVKAEPTPANAKRHAEGPLSIFRQSLIPKFSKLNFRPPGDRANLLVRRNPTAWLAVLVLAGTMLSAKPVWAADGSNDPVLNLLLEKGVITQDEAAKTEAQLAAARTNESAPYLDSKWKVSSGIKSVELYGDLRLRFEDRQEKDPSGGNIELQRFRYAARLGLKGDAADDVYYGFRLETSSNPRSSMVTLGTSSSSNPYVGPYGKSQNGINVGQIYLGWDPESWVDLTAGKMPNPLFTSSMVWSSSINPEGLAEEFKAPVGPADFFATFGQFLYQDLNPVSATPDLGLGFNNGATGQDSQNIFQLAWQGGLTYHLTPTTSFKIAATFYQYVGLRQGTSTSEIAPFYGDTYVGEGAYTGPGSAYYTQANGYSGYTTSGLPSQVNPQTGAYSLNYPNNQTGINDLQVIEVPFELRFKISKLDSLVFGDFAYNLEGTQRADAAATAYQEYLNSQSATIKGFSPQTSDVKAYQFGVALASEGGLGLVNAATAKKHAWELRTYWQHIEQYSLDPNLLDLDFNAGAENLQGIYAAAAYGFTDNFIGSFRYGYASRINNALGTGGTGTDIPQINPITQYNIFQVDLTLKF